MTTAFVDTGAWIALIRARDTHHRAANQFFRGLPRGTHLVTSNMVLSEAFTWFAYRGTAPAAEALRDRVEAARQIRLLVVEWVDERDHEEAWALFRKFGDVPLSFVDCTSIAIARRVGAEFVFGFDSDFERVGVELRPAQT